MSTIVSLYERLVGLLSGKFFEAVALFITRLALAGVFWRSYKTKVEEGSWFEVSDITYFLFEHEFAGLPLSASVAAPLATYAEFLFPILLALGLATRFSAFALLIMALVIQIFVFPTADHFFGWAITIMGMAAILIVRGGGMFALDRLLGRAAGFALQPVSFDAASAKSVA